MKQKKPKTKAKRKVGSKLKPHQRKNLVYVPRKSWNQIWNVGSKQNPFGSGIKVKFVIQNKTRRGWIETGDSFRGKAKAKSVLDSYVKKDIEARKSGLYRNQMRFRIKKIGGRKSTANRIWPYDAFKK